MKSDRELLKSAKEVLFDVAVRQRSGVTDNGAAIVPFETLLDCADMVAAIEDRLAQPEQEPVAYLYKNIEDYEKHVGFECNDAFIVGWNMARTTERMLSNYFYTAPPHREWVGLNPKEISEITMYCQNENPAFFALEVESKLKEKNT